MATYKPYDPDDDDTAGTGGKSGSIEFKDFLSSGATLRDDQLPIDVLNRMISLHEQTNESRVKKQKELGDQRKLLKEGKLSLDDYRDQFNNEKSGFKSHPAFENSPQFHDPQVSAIPSEANTQTNDELKNELQHDYQLKYQPEYKPQPKLTSTPKLTRS